MLRCSGIRLTIAVFALAVGTVPRPIAVQASSYTFLGSWPTPGPPLGLAIDHNGDVLLSTTEAAPPILRYSPDGTLLSQIGFSGHLDVYGIAVWPNGWPNGDIFYADFSRSRVWHISSTGESIAGWGRSDCCFRYIAADGYRNVYLTDTFNSMVSRYTSHETYGDFLAAEWPAHRPSGIAYSPEGILYVASLDGGTITKHMLEGNLLDSFETGVAYAEALAVGPDYRLYLVDRGTSRVLIFSTDGNLEDTIESSPPGYDYGPAEYVGLAVAGDGTIFVGDYAHGRVLKFGVLPTPVKGLTWGGVKARYR